MDSNLHRLIQTAFDAAATPQVAAGRRRKKIWELHHRAHCPLVGTCLPVAEMRKIAARVGHEERSMSDYSLHATFVGSCETRTEVAEQLQRFFEKRYAAALQRFGRARGEDEVLAQWQEALNSGKDIAGALWAAWTHADMGESGGQKLFGDIHMLSHQVGAEARADLRALERLKQENHDLRNEVAAFRMGLAVAQREKDKAVADLQHRLADAEQRAALLGHRELEIAEARKALRDHATLRDRAMALTERVETLEERNAENARRARSLAAELNECQDALAAAETALEMSLGIGECEGVSGPGGCARACPAEARLAGRCVLCIGGRKNLVNGYRRLVETQGGRFLHHDGGQEESLHRIDAVVSSADAVVCQAGCVSHAAYYRLKDACKKLGKPCLFVQSPGIGSFARSLTALTASDAISLSAGRSAAPAG